MGMPRTMRATSGRRSLVTWVVVRRPVSGRDECQCRRVMRAGVRVNRLERDKRKTGREKRGQHAGQSAISHFQG